MEKPIEIKIGSETPNLGNALQQMKNNLPDLLEYVVLVARIKKGAYAAYIKEGFTEKEALELCKAGIFSP